MNFKEPRSSFALYKASAVDSTLFQKMFLPRGYYLSGDDVKMYSPLFVEYVPYSRTLVLVKYVHLIFVGIMTAIPATGDGCNAVIPLIAIISSLTSLYELVSIRTCARTTRQGRSSDRRPKRYALRGRGDRDVLN